jgi:superfamily II DNA/RNA helicase
MIRANFLKRLESSIKSFELSIERTIAKINELIDKISKNISSNIDTNQEFEEQDDDLIGKLEINISHIDKESYILELKKDLKSLDPILKNSKKVNPQRDGKLNDIKSLIQKKVSNPINNINGTPNKKIIIFTAYSETAEYLYENIKNWAKENLNIYSAIVTGSKESCKTNFNPSGFISLNDFNSILINFSPNSKNRNLLSRMPQNQEIDILIATDCISEGQNLQDCDYLINFDIHWNPVKLIQRFGRIDRLGSQNEKIQMVNFWPVAELDKYINLESRVKSRMALVDISASGDDNLLHDDLEIIEDRELKYRNQQLQKLKDTPLDLEETHESVTLNQFNFDSFRMDIANFIQKSSESFKKYPSGLYAVVPSPEKEEFSYYKDINLSQQELIKSGVIFCLKYNSEKSYKEFEKINPLHPYFLVYIDKNGNSIIKNNNPKNILNIYHFLCKGVNKPFEESCKEFNISTDNGENMSIYGSLLKDSVKWIKQQISSSINQSFQTSIDFEIPDEQENVDEKSFELITWLVIN